MASVHIRRRQNANGQPSFQVRYRRGGRAWKLETAGTFKTLKHARTRADMVGGWLAAMKDPKAEMRALAARPQQRTVGQWAEAYKTSRIDLAEQSKTTMRSHILRINRRFELLTPPEISQQDVQEWIVELSADLAPASVRRYVDTLRMILDYAGLEPNPARGKHLRFPRVEPVEKRVPTTSQIAAMLDKTPERWRLPLRVLAETGARVGEVGAWTWGDVDLESSRILNRSGKTRVARRWVAIPAELLAEVAATCPPEDRTADRVLFRGFTPDVAKNVMARACKYAGVAHMSPHDLRHRYISLQLARGVPVAAVSAQVGHSKKSLTLDVYTHQVVEDDEVRASPATPLEEK